MYNHFVIPFSIGVVVLLATLLYKYVSWFVALPTGDKKAVYGSIFTTKTISAFWHVIKESLLHVSIFKHNFWLGYMHSSLAFGWFMLIVVGAIEVSLSSSGSFEPLYVHIFHKFFYPVAADTATAKIFTFLMDLILLYVLTGVAFAWYKRMRKGSMGMRRRTKHTIGDRLALSSLWFIFPARLLAESATAAVYGSGGFMTGFIGEQMSHIPNIEVFVLPLWWFYSVVLCVFFVSMPFSRYMHIFTEIPHIFLKKWGVSPKNNNYNRSDNFQVHSCSRCGICIDPCQLQKDLNINTMQAVYYLRNRRQDELNMESIDNCLMCGRCESKCPVGIDINTLRLGSRHKYHGGDAANRYLYLKAFSPSAMIDQKSSVIRKNDKIKSLTRPKIGYFAGCMTMLQPATINSMSKIFRQAEREVWFADSDGGACCGRPLMLSGELEAATKLMEFNKELFKASGIKLLVTSCPICAKVFKEDYALEDIEVLHHTQYIDELLQNGVIKVKQDSEVYAYHDPCELGRGMGVYDEPRRVIQSVGELCEAKDNRQHALCCGHSLANTQIQGSEKRKIGTRVLETYKATGAKKLVTACPQCKSAFHVNKLDMKAIDISEIVANNLIETTNIN